MSKKECRICYDTGRLCRICPCKDPVHLSCVMMFIKKSGRHKTCPTCARPYFRNRQNIKNRYSVVLTVAKTAKTALFISMRLLYLNYQTEDLLYLVTGGIFFVFCAMDLHTSYSVFTGRKIWLDDTLAPVVI